MLHLFRKLRDQSSIVRTLHRYAREPYYRVLERFYPNGVAMELPSGDRFRIHPRFLGMGLSHYEPQLVQTFCGIVRSGMTVIDVGAHVGIYAMMASRKVGPAGKVISVEPSPANAGLLRRHLRVNQCDNVEVIEAAIGEKPGEIAFTFRPDPTDPAAFANSMAYDIEGERTTVPVVTLNDVCRSLTPGLLKIDVEGAELLALRGADAVLGRHRPVVIVAIHPEPMRMLGTTPRQLVEYMTGLGYAGKTLDGRDADDPGFEELIFRPAGNIATP
jgi:FkbM family methyltransferase